MGKRLYFKSSHKIAQQRSEFMEENSRLLEVVMHNIWYKEYKRAMKGNERFIERTDFFGEVIKHEYYHHVNDLKSKVRDSRRNTLTEEEAKEMISVLEDALNYQENLGILGDQLIDYIYELTHSYIEEHKHEVGMRRLLKLDTDENDQVEQDENDVSKETNEGPKEKPQESTVSLSRYPRNKEVSNRALKLAQYRCEADEKHVYFISAITNENYVEAHHFIPLQFQDEFDYSLDVLENIISLCVVCHKKLHHSKFDEKKDTLRQLYNEREARMRERGIWLPLDQLFIYYKGNLQED
jgi:hypothetical protein